MKNLIKITSIILSLFFLSSCKDKEKDCCKKENRKMVASQSSLSNESIFNLEAKWINQQKDSIVLKDLSTKITIAAMVFTHCESACPRIVADIQRIEKSFSAEELEHIQFLLISMDPARDTPERFLEFSADYQLNNHWICISSSANATMELANVLNVRIKKLSSGGFDHSNTIHLIDKNGNIVFQQNGLAQEPTDIVQAAKKLLK